MAIPRSRRKEPDHQRKHHQQSVLHYWYKGRLVGHGTRHTASTLLREHGWPKEHVEAQLAHKEQGISGIYNKAQYLDNRIKMMQWYADHLEELSAGNVVHADFGKAI